MADIPLFDPQDDDQKLLAQVIAYYQHSLKDSPEALKFLRARGITAGEALDRFRIGYANRTLGLKLPSMRSKAGNRIRSRLQQIGIFRPSGHEHFSGCVTFPVMAADGSGRIVDLYGRKTHGLRLRRGTALDVHLSDQPRGVWNLEAFQASSEMILCTSLFDALAFWSAGLRNVTCTFEDSLTNDHLAALHEFEIQRVLLTSEALASRLTDAGLEWYLLTFPTGMSVSEYASQSSEPPQALGEIIRKAQWLGKGQPAPKCMDSKELDAKEDDWDGEGEPAPAPILSVSPLPPAPQELEADVNGDEVTIHLGHRRYRVRGLSRNLAFDQMKVNLLACTDQGMYVDTLDLYVARHRRQFTAQAAIELGVEEQTVKKDLGRVLLKLEELQDQLVTAATEPQEPAPSMTPEEREAALELLRDPGLLDRIVADFDVVGETTNKLVGYLAAISRKLDQPLALIIQSSSAAGKTSLMEAILSFVPPEDQVKYSAMTGQSLFYVGETDLKHKILAIVEEEGAERASYALKLLQSEGALTIASTGKDSGTGRLVAQEYRVEGPVMIFLTTTAIKIDEELLNRCIVLSVDEDREQTRAIHQFQRRRQTLAGLLAQRDRQEALSLQRNAQRLLRPLLVTNPHAERLTFLDDKTRTRRDHLKYLTLIRTVALLHQYQRPIKTTVHHGQTVEYIEATLGDIALANRLACEVLGRSIDELPPHTRRLLGLLDEMVTGNSEHLGLDRADYRFSRRDIREFTDWGNTQLKIHLRRLEDLEYLLVHRGGRGQSFVYELLYDPPADDQSKFLARLSDVEQLRREYDATGRGTDAEKSESSRGEVGLKSAPGRPSQIDATGEASTASLP